MATIDKKNTIANELEVCQKALHKVYKEAYQEAYQKYLQWSLQEAQEEAEVKAIRNLPLALHLSGLEDKTIIDLMLNIEKDL